MLHELFDRLAAPGRLGARGWARALLRADGLGEKIDGLDRTRRWMPCSQDIMAAWRTNHLRRMQVIRLIEI
jgi:hypothetical protein